MRRAMSLLLLTLSLAAAPGCGARQVGVTGTVAGDGGAGWSATVGVTITLARDAVPPLCAGLATDASIPRPTRDAIAVACRDTQDALAAAADALDVYARTGAAGDACRLRAAVDAALGHQADLYALAADARVVVPPEVPATLGALGAIVDALGAPACAADGGASGQRRVAAVLARGGAR